MGRTKPIVSPEYVVGLTDGEGCFYVNVRQSLAYRAGAVVQLHFHIKLNQRDKEVLQKVCNTLDCGEVYFQKEKRANHTQCYRFTVASHTAILEKIIPFFTQHPLQSVSKRENFAIFCKVANFVKNKKHLTKKGIEQIRRWKSLMNRKNVGLA